MSFRIFEGHVLSAEGWRMCNADECVWVEIPGTTVTIQVRSGIPAVILPAFVARYNQLVEPVRDPDTACWTLNNDVSTSNHPAGIAVDINWNTHAFHAYGTFGDRLSKLRQVQDEFRGCIQWGGDWGGNPQDEMHHELAYPEGYLDDNGNFVLDVDQRLIDLANDLRAGYLGIYVPGVTPAPPSDDHAVAILSQAMGGTVSMDRYRQLLPAVSKCLIDCGCTTVKRIAMWDAQVGHEGVGLKYMEEIWGPTAAQVGYEGRTDLGNTQPGDGYRFRGRGPIQVTGRRNYTVLSRWAFDQGLVSSPTFFVDDPDQLASDTYGFAGVTWYWTTQRPMNQAADVQDLTLATQYVNGGTNGLADRQARYSNALAMGDQLLELLTTGDEDEMAGWTADLVSRAMLLLENQTGVERPSLSPLRHWGEGNVNTCAGFAWSADGLTHPQFVLSMARVGHAASIALIAEVANGDLRIEPDRADDKALAVSMLADLEKNNPAALQGYLATKAAA